MKRVPLPWLGVLAIVFYAIHGLYHIAHRHPEDLLWMCHLGALIVGVGLTARSRVAIAGGVLWLLAGIPLWIVYLVSGGEFLPTSLLTHGGGLAVGIEGVRRLGLPKGVAWKAGVALVPLYLLSRLTSSAQENVNLVFSIWPGLGRCLPCEWACVLAVLLAAFGILVGLELGLRRLGLAERTT